MNYTEEAKNFVPKIEELSAKAEKILETSVKTLGTAALGSKITPRMTSTLLDIVDDVSRVPWLGKLMVYTLTDEDDNGQLENVLIPETLQRSVTSIENTLEDAETVLNAILEGTNN